MAEPPLVLADADWRVEVDLAHGLLIRAASDARSGAPALWQREAPVPSAPSRALGPAGPPSVDTFHDAFVGGWFPMFPAAGFTGELDGRATHFHGELARLPWELTDRGATWVEARVETVHAPFAVVRRVALDGGELHVETDVANVGAAPASYLFGEHPCFWRETFAGGRLELEARAAWVPSPAYAPEQAALVPGVRFAWSLAPRAGGGTLDLSVVPEQPDGRGDHACLELASPRIRLTAPRFGRALELDLDLATTPYALLSMGYGAGWDMLAVEPASAPGRGVEDALAAGAVRRLGAGERFRTAMALHWTD